MLVWKHFTAGVISNVLIPASAVGVFWGDGLMKPYQSHISHSVSADDHRINASRCVKMFGVTRWRVGLSLRPHTLTGHPQGIHCLSDTYQICKHFSKSQVLIWLAGFIQHIHQVHNTTKLRQTLPNFVKGVIGCPFSTSWYDSLGSLWNVWKILWLIFLNGHQNKIKNSLITETV